MKRDKYFKRFFILLTVVFVVITFLSAWAIAYGITRQCEQYMLRETSALVSADATQLQLNINSYFGSIEGNVALMFADEDSMAYDSSTTTLDEYEKINIENKISNRIVDLGALENYSDFLVVYANDNTVGWKSKTTQNMYSDGGIYEDMCSYITNEKTQDGWAFGVQGNTDRLYYVKRYNPNAIIITSFYTRELVRTFQYPDELEGMCVRLVDPSGHIVYSSDTTEIGQYLQGEEKVYFEKGNKISAVTETKLINIDSCDNNWAVMCTMSRDAMMDQFYLLRKYAYYFTAIFNLIILVIIIGVVLSLSKPVDGYVGDLSEKANVDRLSGVLNRRAFEEQSTENLELKKYPESAFLMFDVDNFKQINDNLGHDYGDDVIARMGKLLSGFFMDNSESTSAVGRLGGDEFAVFVGFDQTDNADEIQRLLDAVLNGFEYEFAKERETLPISISAGFAMNTDTAPDYQSMYSAADSALYVSKQSGKNQYHRYEEGKKNEA